MNSLARFSRGKLCQDFIIRLQSTATSSISSDVHIPNRIERGPTDILKALESTISRDYTAPHYKYHDDPYLTPRSRGQIRVFALAKESGKKAAMWIRQEHSDLFQHKVAEPSIKAFEPPSIYTEENKVTEETLLYEISNGHVPNAVLIYDLLKGEVSVSAKQALLELLCFYNNTEPISTELLESRWFQIDQTRNKTVWINRPHIDTLFEFLKKQESAVAAAAYDIMIRGLTKYHNVEKAWYLYTECQENNIPLSVEAYNAVMSMTSQLKEADDQSKTLIKNIYTAMARNGIIPNIHTFNAVLNTASILKNKRAALDLTCNVFADIAKFNLKPTLTTYYYVLRVLQKFGDAAYKTFIKILQFLKEETLIIQDQRDFNFFVTAMDMASKKYCKREAGEMLNELLLIGENYKFIGDSMKENVYYRSYLELILATEDFETFFKLYSKLVPHVTVPEPYVIKTILEALQLHPGQTATQYVPKLWSHILMFDYLDKEGLLENLVYLMKVHCKPEPNSPLNAQFAEYAVIIWDHVQDQTSGKLEHISNTVAGNIIILLLRGDYFDKAVEVISTLNSSPHLIVGVITKEHINEIFELCLAQAHVPAIFTLLEYVTSCSLEGAGEMAKKLHKTVPLTSSQENILTSLVGDVFKLQAFDEN
ncbi:protein PTCD3 homolog, mitochondrial [Pseudomyrmex gracilis]|uniref:protein PTCD3 homolog, mitochondrial n=1 Tax=Pseudomyrmex gracilis TaxID=219809 RepID=UPI000995AE32|nr:protein PTCD3 homolog, mitochondrial [Pseudomyrmex gracilis]